LRAFFFQDYVSSAGVQPAVI